MPALRSLRLTARQIAGEIPYRCGARRPTPNSLSVLMYHAVTREELRDPQQQSVSAAQFSDQLKTLRDLGLRCVSLEEGLRSLTEGTGSEPMASIVFDDGYVGVHDLALTVLAQYRIPITLFLATEWIGRASFPGSAPRWGRPLSWTEVGDLIRETGCTVGSHGHSHRVLARLSAEEIRSELKTSKTAIEDRLQRPCRLFAYPYGGRGTFDARTRQLLSEEGFTTACTTVWGRCRAGTDPFSVPRMRVSWCDTRRELKKSLAGCYDGYRFFQ